MTLDEFRRHPAYDYYIRTLVSNCLICELDNKFDYKYKNIVYIKPNFENETKDYIIRVPREIIEESEEYIQFLIAYDNYKDLEYIRKDEVVVFEKGGFVGNLGLSKKILNKYVEVWRKYKTDTDKMTASDYTHLFGYLNPYYRAAYSIPKRKR